MSHKITPDMENPFHTRPEEYDSWYDSEKGRTIFTMETRCLETLMKEKGRTWLEVGVGTGRFAEALGVLEGVDPSPGMLELASRRGILTRVGFGEELPYADDTFDGVLMVTTLCFLSEPDKVLKECGRVVKKGGHLVLGVIPAGSPWAEHYAQKGAQGDPFYSRARYYTCEKAVYMAEAAGFYYERAVSCLFTPPGKPPEDSEQVSHHLAKGASFAALRFIYMPTSG